MNNEEILKLFLKKHRKLASFKRQVFRNVTCDVESVFYVSMPWISSEEGGNFWSLMHIKWEQLCKDFNLKGSISVSRIVK